MRKSEAITRLCKRIASLENFLGLNYAEPTNIKSEFSEGAHYWRGAEEWAWLEKLKEEREEQMGKKGKNKKLLID